jgi:hypothetical protein
MCETEKRKQKNRGGGFRVHFNAVVASAPSGRKRGRGLSPLLSGRALAECEKPCIWGGRWNIGHRVDGPGDLSLHPCFVEVAAVIARLLSACGLHSPATYRIGFPERTVGTREQRGIVLLLSISVEQPFFKTGERHPACAPQRGASSSWPWLRGLRRGTV